MARACEYAYVTEWAWRDVDGWDEKCLPLPPDDPDYEQYQLDLEEVERRTLGYRHVLQSLWRKSPALAKLDTSPAQLAAGVHASDSNSQPCPCGSGLRRALIPWALHREAWGFCACDDATALREEMKNAAGFAGYNMFGYVGQ